MYAVSVLFFLPLVWGALERCSIGYVYRIQTTENVTGDEFSSIAAYAFPSAIKIDIRNENDVMLFTNDEYTYNDINGALGSMNIIVTYVNQLDNAQSYQKVISLINKYSISKPFDDMEYYYYPNKCEVYIPPTSETGGGGSGPETKEILDYLKLVEGYVKQAKEYLATLQSIIQTTTESLSILKNVYQGSYQIYQFLTGRAAPGPGEICPVPGEIMAVVPQLPPPPTSLQYAPIPPATNDFAFMVELLSNTTNVEASRMFKTTDNPFEFYEGDFESTRLDLFIGGHENVFGIDWDKETSQRWINVMGADQYKKLIITLQLPNGHGMKGDPGEYPAGSTVVMKYSSFTSKYYPYKFEEIRYINCPPEPSRCLLYKQIIVDKTLLKEYFHNHFVFCMKKK